MDDLTVNIDIDIWRYGRDAAQAGRLSNKMLRACYPYVEFDHRKQMKIEEILQENFERNPTGQPPYLVRQGVVFFQDREDADLFHGLLYIY